LTESYSRPVLAVFFQAAANSTLYGAPQNVDGAPQNVDYAELNIMRSGVV
jgi:hypothetical protein